MPVMQSWNARTKRWVKFEFTKKNGFKVLDVKEKDPTKPFKGIKINKGRR